MTLPPPPLPPALALALGYAEAERAIRLNRSRPRSDAYREAVGATNAIRELAVRLGFGGSALVAAFMDTVATGEGLDRRYVVEPGPDWLHTTALAMAERLDQRAEALR